MKDTSVARVFEKIKKNMKKGVDFLRLMAYNDECLKEITKKYAPLAQLVEQ